MKRLFVSSLLLFITWLICPAYGENLNIMEMDLLFEKSFHSVAHNIFSNKKGDVVYFTDTPLGCVYWSKDTGEEVIAVDDFIKQLGLEPNNSYPYAIPIYIDDLSNVFVIIYQQMTHGYHHKLCVWNKKFGFKLLNIPGIVELNIPHAPVISEDRIVVSGKDSSSKSRLIIMKNPHYFWDEQRLESTKNDDKEDPVSPQSFDLGSPWDNIPMGKFGARLYTIGLLYKASKCSKCDKDCKTFGLMVEAEAAHVLDKLQATQKRAQALIDKARAECIIDEQAQKDYTDATAQIQALKKYLKSLDISNARIISLELPSNNWKPQNH